jgi:hypothetical protein
MIRSRVTLLTTAALIAVTASPAAAVVEAERDWMNRRMPGSALADDPVPAPSGWRWGAAMTFPYTLAASLAYLGPAADRATYKVGASWGLHDGRNTVAGDLRDYRVYGSLVYYFVPGLPGGPYAETGLGLAKASGAVLPLNWPVVPHIGFGTNGWWNKTTAWDLTFSATANGVLSLEGGLLF